MSRPALENDATRPVSLRRLSADGEHERDDLVAHEEPLELQVNGRSLAVLMRTPGHDEELGLGFLFTEGVVRHPADVVSLRHCTVAPSPEAEDNVLQAQLTAPVDFDRHRRHSFASSSCGVCGKATLENALAVSAPLDSPLRVPRQTLGALPARLRPTQAAFDATGGLHAAALFTPAGELLVTREDVGRHNAFDKVVGWALREGVRLDEALMLVSGRVSFELVQKSVAARVPVIAGVSAPTSLAVRMAEALGVTLVGFLREGAMNVYAGRQRVL